MKATTTQAPQTAPVTNSQQPVTTKPRRTRTPAHSYPHPFGLGIAEHEDLVWLTSRATGAVVFTGTSRQLMERTDLVAACSQRQRDELAKAYSDAGQYMAATIETNQTQSDLISKHEAKKCAAFVERMQTARAAKRAARQSVDTVQPPEKTSFSEVGEGVAA